MVNTQYNTQMIYCRIVHLKPAFLLTNVTPVNSVYSIKNKYYQDLSLFFKSAEDSLFFLSAHAKSGAWAERHQNWRGKWLRDKLGERKNNQSAQDWGTGQ